MVNRKQEKQEREKQMLKIIKQHVNDQIITEGLADENSFDMIKKLPVTAYIVLRKGDEIYTRPLTSKLSKDVLLENGEVSLSNFQDIITGASIFEYESLISIVPCNILTFEVWGMIPNHDDTKKHLIEQDYILVDSFKPLFLGYEYPQRVKTRWIEILKEKWNILLLEIFKEVEKEKESAERMNE